MIFLQDNTPGDEQPPETIKELLPYAGVSLSKLQEKNPGLLVFPDGLGKYGDNWSDEPLFKLNGGRIATGNVVGFFGIKDIQVQIGSRFDACPELPQEKSPPQYFLNYMLTRAFGINMLNMPAAMDPEPIWDFLFYLFVYYLKKALNQGIFRTYRTFERNDDHVRGAIDIPRHLRLNMPFRGTIAYRTREYSANNPMMHLIRHTIEAIRANPRASGLLTADEGIRADVRTITELTPNYSRHDLSKVIAKNLRPMRHPYFTEYAGLQRICLKILRHERITYGQSEEKLNGIVFKAEWLWEEYLATVLKECGIRHAQNTLGKHPIPIYKGKTEPRIYPDFFSENLVMDAKYKTGDNDKRDDRFQIISYLHIRKAKAGFLIYPNNEIRVDKIEFEGILNGFGGSIGFIKFAVPKGASSFAVFQDKIKISEEELKIIVKEQDELASSVPAEQL
ncbi:MAG: restriction endonuclease [Lentisphaeria bacterium]|nr:restriction endonuclease [Lentisphaeria bacterium]